MTPESSVPANSGCPAILEGSANFRDLGGYPTEAGRRIRRGQLFRAGNMARLTDTDHQVLARLAIKTICDLRSTHEREAEPYVWCSVAGVAYWACDSSESFADLGRLIATGQLTAETARTTMIEGYRRLPFEQAAAVTELLRRLAVGELPLVFNCSAGKDRTGVAAAIILSVLGVSRATIIKDYLLTNEILRGNPMFRERIQGLAALSKAQNEGMSVVLSADPAYLNAALTAIEDSYSTIDVYVRNRLGISDKLRAHIHEQLLE